MMSVSLTLAHSHAPAGDYEKAVEASNSAETITRVLYPNDNHYGPYSFPAY